MNRRSLFFILFFLALPQFAIDLYLPSLPSMVHVLHSNISTVQLTVSLYMVGIAASTLFYGPISDSVGRKPVIIFASVIAVLGSLLCALSQTIDVLLIGRFIQGLGMGFGAGLSRAVLRDLCHGTKLMAKIISYQYMTWSMVPLLAPVFGGYIQHYFGWRMNFIVILALSILNLMLVIFLFTESKAYNLRQPLHFGKTLQGYWFVIKNISEFSYILLVLLQFSSLFVIIQLSPFIFQVELGFSAAMYGWFILIVGLGSFVGGLLNRTVSQHYPLDKIILTMVIGAFVTSIVLNLLSIPWFNVWVILIPIFIIRLFGGLTYSNCMAQAMRHHPERVGTVSSLASMASTTGAAIISAIVAHIPQYKQFTLTIPLSIIFAIMLALFTFVLWYRKQKQPVLHKN